MGNDHVMALIYGAPKRAKTSMVLSAFPNALWIPGEGKTAIKSVALNEYGFEPAIYEHPIKKLDDLIAVLHEVIENNYLEGFDGLCVDGFTALCDSHLRWWDDNPRLTAQGKVDQWYGYQDLKNKLSTVSEMLLHIPANTVLVAHEQPPSQKEGVLIPGGPSLGSKGQVMRIPAWCDLNARAVVNTKYPDPWLKGGLDVDVSDVTWVTGDRNGVAYKGSPPNVREILHASEMDYALSRVAGLEWQDEVADHVAGIICDTKDIEQAVTEGLQMAQGMAQTGRRGGLHARWAVQDGVARGIIRRRQQASIFDTSALFQKASGNKPAPPPQ